MNSKKERVSDLPRYYDDVVKGAQAITKGVALNLCSDGESFHKYKTPDSQTDEGETRIIKFLDPKGQITSNLRSAVAVLLDSNGDGVSAVFFKKRFTQVLDD